MAQNHFWIQVTKIKFFTTFRFFGHSSRVQCYPWGLSINCIAVEIYMIAKGKFWPNSQSVTHSLNYYTYTTTRVTTLFPFCWNVNQFSYHMQIFVSSSKSERNVRKHSEWDRTSVQLHSGTQTTLVWKMVSCEQNRCSMIIRVQYVYRLA